MTPQWSRYRHADDPYNYPAQRSHDMQSAQAIRTHFAATGSHLAALSVDDIAEVLRLRHLTWGAGLGGGVPWLGAE